MDKSLNNFVVNEVRWRDLLLTQQIVDKTCIIIRVRDVTRFYDATDVPDSNQHFPCNRPDFIIRSTDWSETKKCIGKNVSII